MATVCVETGRLEVDAECPVHHGDACMVDVTQLDRVYTKYREALIKIRAAPCERECGCLAARLADLALEPVRGG